MKIIITICRCIKYVKNFDLNVFCLFIKFIFVGGHIEHIARLKYINIYKKS